MAAIGHVGVVGAGLAGLATALAAARAGVQVDVFEARPEPVRPDSHIDLVPNLLRDLAALGLGEACVRRGFPYHGVAVQDGDGRIHFEVPTPRLAGDRWPASVGMVYGALLAALRAAAVAQGVRLHLGQRVVDAGDDGAIALAGGPRWPVDLAVVACGDDLPAVGGAPLPPVPKDAPTQQWCHALLPRPRGLDRATWVIGLGALRAMVVPVGTARAGIALLVPAEVGTGHSPPPTETPEGSDASQAPVAPARLRRLLELQGRWLRDLAPHLPDAVPVHMRTVRPGVLAGDWHQHGVLRVGGSAHCLAPNFGQSAAQALEDACVLGELLGAGLERAALLAAFMARRGERARTVHALTGQAARWQIRPEASTDLHRLMQLLAPAVAEPA
jgi:2-polyprenyl-6-methoxyphenol hydroxylase-like FAD-dependent oxidoreductase